MHNDFTLFVRTYPNGTKVVFYHAYNEKDERVGPWTTKCKNLTAARVFCNRLLKDGCLIPVKTKPVTFAEFADGFWEKNSEYIRRQESRRSMSENYIDHSNQCLKNQILPFFGDKPITDITEEQINDWLIGFKDRGRLDKDGNRTKNKDGTFKCYKNSYGNTCLSVLNVMFMEAVRRKYVAVNPCTNVKPLKKDSRKVIIFTADEIDLLFPENPLPIWGGKEIHYIANRLGSLTGMRIGEIMGLRGEYVFNDHIRVCGQYGQYGYLDHTKTNQDRNIPLPSEMIALLRTLIKKNGKGFVFSENEGETPVAQNEIRKEFKRALKRIGLTADDIKKRGLTPHSWRHFLNTELLTQGLSIPQVQGVTGHNSVRTTRHYSHLDPLQVKAITNAQKKILRKDKPEKKKPKMQNKEPGRKPQNTRIGQFSRKPKTANKTMQRRSV